MYFAVRYIGLWFVSVYYIVLQFLKVYCSILQCTTDVENLLQFNKAYYSV